MLGPTTLNLSGERFSVEYHFFGTIDIARQMAKELSIEQTIEFPADLLPEDDIAGQIVARIDWFEQIDNLHHHAEISYALEIFDGSLAQFLNILCGNTNLKSGIRVSRINLPPKILESFSGPRFGIPGIRRRLNVKDRPIVLSALKPMGLPVDRLASIARDFALGGVDLIKDDHGIADQVFCPFEQRLERISATLAEVNEKYGTNCGYLPNISGSLKELRSRALMAKKAGAFGLLVAPGLVGFEGLKAIAEDDEIALPIIAHPALLGSYVVHDSNGFSPGTLFGQIIRLAGADGFIFPHYGGRFPRFDKIVCASIVDGLRSPLGNFPWSFPIPGGGITLSRLSEILTFYGRDVLLLIGGNLHQGSETLVDNCKNLMAKINDISKLWQIATPSPL